MSSYTDPSAGNQAAPNPAPIGAPQKSHIGLIVAIVVVIAVVVAAVIIMTNRPGSGPTPASGTGSASQSQTTTPPPPVAGQVVPPGGNSGRAWITVPSDNTKDDALIVDIQFDYQCPFCELAETSFGEAFQELSDRGDIILRLHTRTFLDGAGGQTFAGSTQPAIAAACVDYAAPDKYGAYHMTIFANQPHNEGTGYSDTYLRVDFPAAVNLTGDALATFQSCYDNQATADWVKDVENNNLHAIPNPDGFPAYLFGGNTPHTDTDGRITGTPGTLYGVAGTPSFFVQGVEFDLGALLNSDYTPKIATTPDALLTLLQQIAQS